VGGESGLPTLQPDDTLARHLGGESPGSFCLVRPDAYRAALLTDPTPTAIAAALRTALAQDT
jgi:3-(3-hydroxy-phenyl)propionate hydroxylase